MRNNIYTHHFVNKLGPKLKISFVKVLVVFILALAFLEISSSLLLCLLVALLFVVIDIATVLREF